MAAADLPGTDEERAEAALIAAAGNILRSENREVPEDFVEALVLRGVHQFVRDKGALSPTIRPDKNSVLDREPARS